MSIVTDVVVHTGRLESASAIRAFVGWFDRPDGAGRGRPGPIGRIDSSSGSFAGWGGTHTPHCDLWGGSFNHFPRQDFLDHVAAVDWVSPELVQVLIKHESERRPAVFVLDGGRCVEVVSSAPADDVAAPPDGECWFEDPELAARYRRPVP